MPIRTVGIGLIRASDRQCVDQVEAAADGKVKPMGVVQSSADRTRSLEGRL
jgi:hypothetical protein